ncbi:hypothetical protein Btru_054656 [Bulinus truncatus]|nr:hypothetical protein Btru_054656 [Bulinus truncatus]
MYSNNRSNCSSEYERQGFLKHYLWFLCIIGLPGNVLTILVVLSHKSSKPATLLIGCLAMFDSVALVTKLIESQVIFNDVRLGRYGCKFIYIPSAISASVANWTLAFICAERFITVCYPLKRLYLMTAQRSKGVLVAMTAVMLSYVTAMYLTFMDFSGGRPQCVIGYISLYTFFMIQYTSHIIAPFALITFFAVLVIRQLRVSRANRNELRRQLSINESPIVRQECLENKMSLLMISAAILYFAVNAPSCIFYTIIWPSVGCIPQDVFTYVNDTLYVVNDSSHALNFFIYFVLVKGFRTDLYNAIHKLIKSQ